MPKLEGEFVEISRSYRFNQNSENKPQNAICHTLYSHPYAQTLLQSGDGSRMRSKWCLFLWQRWLCLWSHAVTCLSWANMKCTRQLTQWKEDGFGKNVETALCIASWLTCLYFGWNSQITWSCVGSRRTSAVWLRMSLGTSENTRALFAETREFAEEDSPKGRKTALKPQWLLFAL